jgi:hypothetical protein
MSVAFSVIHTSVKGEMPQGIVYRDWDDPELARRFVDFLSRYIERYSDTIRYVEIGNEVNIYFQSFPEELDAFRVFYSRVVEKIRQTFPDIKVGTIIAYHILRQHKQEKMYRELSLGDFESFTLYVYDNGFVFNHEPREIFEWLQDLEELTGDRAYALEEVGWSTAPTLEGSEPEQAEAVDAFFDYLHRAPARLEYMYWFILHETSLDEGRKQARSFFEELDPAFEESPAMRRFVTFLSLMGLRNKDGTPKAAWHTWTRRAERYQSE